MKTDGEAPAARRRELELLAIVLVGKVLDRECQRHTIAAASEVDTPADAVDREAVERQEVLRNQERRIEQRLSNARHFSLRAHAVLNPPQPARLREPRVGDYLRR